MSWQVLSTGDMAVVKQTQVPAPMQLTRGTDSQQDTEVKK